jgi:hypothetical protein
MQENELFNPPPSKPDDYDSAMRLEIDDRNLNGMTVADAREVTNLLFPDVPAWYAAKSAWFYSVAAPVVKVFANYPALFH